MKETLEQQLRVVVRQGRDAFRRELVAVRPVGDFGRVEAEGLPGSDGEAR